jgi:hypothetical protein
MKWAIHYYPCYARVGHFKTVSLHPWFIDLRSYFPLLLKHRPHFLSVCSQ